jgi:hypothetical protein
MPERQKDWPSECNGLLWLTLHYSCEKKLMAPAVVTSHSTGYKFRPFSRRGYEKLAIRIVYIKGAVQS